MKLTEAEAPHWIQVDVERALLVDRGRTTILCDAGLPDNATLLLRITPAGRAALGAEEKGERK